MGVKTSFYGSIDFSKLMEQAKAGNKAFTKNENGKNLFKRKSLGK
jgi:hypothetical protein